MPFNCQNNSGCHCPYCIWPTPYMEKEYRFEHTRSQPNPLHPIYIHFAEGQVAWWAKSVEEGRLREPSVELPHVGSQSLLSCLWHLLIKEVLKSGACDTRASFRVAQFLCSPNCRIQSQTPWSGFHTAYTRTYNSSCNKARGKTGGQPEAHDRQVNPWLDPVPSSTLHGTCQCSVQACMLLISTQLLLVEDSASGPQGWNTGERQG